MDTALSNPGKRTRMSPDVRRGQIITAAAAVTLEQGYLPLPTDRLAERAGVSKALVYAYFPTQHDLANAVLERRFTALAAAGMEAASLASPLSVAALETARIYFEDVAGHGPLIHVILRDHFMLGRVDRRLAAMRDRVVRNLARAARRSLRMPARETVTAINMIITIPEQAGRLAHSGEMEPGRARALCAQLIASSVDALTPRDD
jgi:AcrR family transcriptional regulator